jgi:hypothetical protein
MNILTNLFKIKITMKNLENTKFSGVLQKVELTQIKGGISGETGLSTEGCNWTNKGVDFRTGTTVWSSDEYGDYYADPCE